MIEDIRKLQRRVGAEPDGVIGPKTIAAINRALDAAAPPSPAPSPPAAPAPSTPPAAALPPGAVQPRQEARPIRTIAVHCSATREGRHFTARDIDQWHRAQGWKEIGYNAVVLLDGTIERGRDEAKVPSHAAGHNRDSIAICYIGGVGADGRPKDTRTPAQKAALAAWLKAKKAQYPQARILGHRDYPGVAKACPSFDAKKEYESL